MASNTPPSAHPRTALIAVDWGTSALRGARLDADGRVLEERASAQGILTVPPDQFATVFEANYGDWIGTYGTISLISGMAGSQQGWVQTPYCPCPAGFDEVAAQLRWIDAKTQRPRIAIVPGLSCEHPHAPDVMRGEEVQIFGAMQLTGLRDGLFVLPGTHSKWAQVQGGRVTGFKTYMTGEFYALLSQHSILAKTLGADGAFDAAAFCQGVDVALQGAGLLHTAFSARSLALFSRLGATPLASYLSGLVIGEELRSQQPQASQTLILIGSDALTSRYAMALARRGVASQRLGSESTWAGLHALAQTLQR